MFKNYFKIALRNLQRNKIFSFINIAGLSIGLAGCLIVANVVIDDLSYDKQWKNADHIYRVISNNKGTREAIPVVPSGMGPALEKNFPEVENYCRVRKDYKTFSQNDNKEKFEVSCIITEPSFLDIFNFTFLQGSPQVAERGYYSVIITQAIKEKYFPNANPMGKQLKNILTTGRIDSSQYIITGVIEEFPYNSHLRAEVIILKQYSNKDNELSKGAGYLYPLYVLLNKTTNTNNFKAKVNNWYKTAATNNFDASNSQAISNSFQPLTRIYLHSEFGGSYQPVVGSVRNVYIFSGIAIVLLLIACFNFINLTIARSLKRITETSVRKVLGANKLQLIYQFLTESLLFFIISFILALFLYQLAIKPVEIYIGHEMTVSLIDNFKLLCASSGVVWLVCIFTGLYPALILARTKPALALKGATSAKPNNNLVRKSLVVGQFVISVVIIIAAIVVKEQLLFLNNTELGYDKNNLLQIDYVKWGNSGSTFKQEIKNISGVESVSIARWGPGAGGGSMSMEVDDPYQKDNKINVWYIEGDVDFAQTLKLKLQEGRFLNDGYAADELNPDAYYKNNEQDKLTELEAQRSVLLSAYAAKILDSGKAKLGVPLRMRGVPVGIVNNFHNESLKTKMKPIIIQANNSISYGNMLVRVKPGSEKRVIHSINKLWTKFYPSQTIQYNWASDALKNQYKAGKKMEQLFFFFSYLTVFLACLGLFGLVNFTTELRRKEIGIRKVLGASVALITSLISKDFLKLVIIAIIIAAPIAYYIMNKWLYDYAYRINVTWWMVSLAGLIAILIALITVSFQAVKAAIANPVESLRTE